MLEIRLIGDMTVVRNGAPAPLPQSKKTRALLAYLVLNPGPHRREKLCEIFWQIPDDPRHSLRWSLSKLRGVVNDDDVERIRADRERVSFEPEGAAVDYLAIKNARKRRADNLSTDELAAFADKFSGALLDGLDLSGQPDYETWRLAKQEEARQVQCAILRMLIDRLDGAPTEQAQRLYEIVTLEPYDVDLHCALISALTRAGRKKEAERQKAQSAGTLKDLDGADLARLDKALREKPQAPTPRAPEKPKFAAPPHHQEIRFCKAADGVKIAYASVGEGPPIVKTANWLNHLEYDWESPVWRHVFDALSEKTRLVRYDARGNGLSDWDTEDFSFDALVSDLEAVVDAAGVDRFTLLGISQGCAVSVEYAARHPEKVRKLVLIGGYARGWNRINAPKITEQTEAMITLIRMGWGTENPAFRQLFTSLFMPDAPSENHRWFNELQKMTTSPANAAYLLRAVGDVDVVERLGDVKAPTLVLHARGDLRVPYNSGRELAAGIPGARFVTLETKNHLMPDTDPAWPKLVSEIETFLESA